MTQNFENAFHCALVWGTVEYAPGDTWTWVYLGYNLTGNLLCGNSLDLNPKHLLQLNEAQTKAN